MSTTASVLIEGNYVDAYLYGGLLVVWDDRGQLIIASTEALASAVAEVVAAPRVVARAAFVDNKLLVDPAAMRRAQRFGRKETNGDDGAMAHIELERLQPRVFAIASEEQVLDLMATYGRLFISTDDSLLSVPFDAAEVGEVRKRLSFRCLSTTPRWGAVSASCAEAGAWALLNEVGVASGSDQRAEQIDASVSVRHSWLGTSLLSFDDTNQFDVFKASVPMRKGEHRVAQGFARASEYGEAADMGWSLPAVVDSSEEVDFVTAFTGLLIAARNGMLEATRVSTWSGFPEPIGVTEHLAEIAGHVLAIEDTVGGFVVETEDELHYVTGRGVVSLLARETISLRAYPRSRRHRRTVTATVEGGLLVSALLGTHPLPLDERHIFVRGR